MDASPILVTGGTGTLGKLVVPLLLDTDRDVRVLSRHSRESSDGVEYVTGDLLKGEGIESAVDGVETILHLAGDAKHDAEATRNLVRVASRAEVRHLVYISVTGADQVPLGYFKTKLASERVVVDSGVPWTTLRAAQFHELVATVMRAVTKSPVVPAPRAVQLQPVDAGEVAARLAELTRGEPAGLVRDLVGPQVLEVADLIRTYLRAHGKRRALAPVPFPGKAGRVYRAGANLSLDGADTGHRTWENFVTYRADDEPAR